MGKFKQLAVGAALMTVVGATQASVWTLEGQTVRFSLDDNGVGAFAPFAGANPLTSTDSLLFNPAAFTTEASGPAQREVRHGDMTLLIEAKSNYLIQDLSWRETGNFDVEGAGKASARASLAVTDLDYNIEQTYNDKRSFVGETDGQYEMSNFFDIEGASKVLVNLSSILKAKAPGVDDYAWIRQTMTRFDVETTAVPLPASLWLLGSAMTGLVTVARRRQSGLSNGQLAA